MSLQARIGNTLFIMSEVHGTPERVEIVRRTQDGETTFYVPKALFEAYAVSRIEEIGGKLVRELFTK